MHPAPPVDLGRGLHTRTRTCGPSFVLPDPNMVAQSLGRATTKAPISQDVWVAFLGLGHPVSIAQPTSSPALPLGDGQPHPDASGQVEWDTVRQTPEVLDMPTGSSLTLTCEVQLRSRVSIKKVVYTWRKAGGNFTHEFHFPTGVPADRYMEEPQVSADSRVSLSVDDSLQKAELRLQGAREEDSGVYYCDVIILQPLPRTPLQGNGTELRISVTSPGETTSLHLPYTVAAASSLILLLALILILVKKTKDCQDWHHLRRYPVLARYASHRRLQSGSFTYTRESDHIQ
ncbi:uncharacterized protein LOC144799961 isoform X2 [Lissotriton helveticus]